MVRRHTSRSWSTRSWGAAGDHPRRVHGRRGILNLIPGPNSTEVAIHVGYARAGWQGLIVAGTCFILPAALLVTAVAWSYVHSAPSPALVAALYGIKPVVLAIIVQAIWRLGRTALTTPRTIAIAVFSVIASTLGVQELMVLAGAALSASLRAGVVRLDCRSSCRGVGPAPGARVTGRWRLRPLAWRARSDCGRSSVCFSRSVRCCLEADMYCSRSFGPTSSSVSLDHGAPTARCIAVGQVTPGPLFTSATFIGYVIGGLPGAAVATIGIFLPAFVFVALSGRMLPKLRQNPAAAGLLDGLNAASLALMAVVTAYLAQTAIVDLPTLALAIAAACVLLFSSLNATWLILGGALTGGLVH